MTRGLIRSLAVALILLVLVAISAAAAALVLLAAGHYGLDAGPLALLAGGLAIAIAITAREPLANLAAGLALLLDGRVKAGDVIAIDGQTGRLRSVGVLRSTLETAERLRLSVPNVELLTRRHAQLAGAAALSEVKISLGASYKSDPRQVIAMLERAASDCTLLCEAPKPRVALTGFGDNALELTLTATASDSADRAAAETELRTRILAALRAAGIEMPFAQHDIHLRDLDGLKMALARVLEERAEKARAAAQHTQGGGKPPGVV
jgi:small-conductance mechanosensitive channel